MKQNVKKLFALLLCAAFLLPVSSQTGLAANTDLATVRIDVTYGQTEARTMLDMVNDFRTGNDAWVWNEDDTTKTTYSDLNPLVYDYELEKVAMQRAAEIALSFSHTRPDGSACWTLYDDAYSSGGENIAAGYSSASAVFEGWQEADEGYAGQGHRRNMLYPSFTAIGIGHAYFNGTHYWVQEFGDPASNATATAANDSKTTVSMDVLLSDATVSLQAEPDSVTVAPGQSQPLPSLHTTIQLPDAWPARASTVSVDYHWSVTDDQYASISDNLVTGIKEGTTTLTTAALGRSLSINLEVALAKQTITAKSYTKVLGDKAFNLGAKTDGDGKLTYKSSDTSVATVSSAGKVTIKGVGSTKITITASATNSCKKATKSVTITVNPTGTKLSSVKNLSGKKMKVTWKSNNKVTGYQIQYSTSSKFKSAKTVTVKSCKTTSKTISKLTKKKKYYVRVRTYQKVSGKTYYSAWSGSKNVTIKK